MLLTDTIKNSTSAIKKRRATIESKQHAETYAKALAQLAQTTESIKGTLDCAAVMKESGIVDTPLMDETTRSDLLTCINDCGNGVSEMKLTLEAVRLLKSKGDAVATQINVMTDLQKFDRLWEQAQRNLPVSQKAHILKRAIHLYRGTVFETACDDHWLVGIATEYKLKYIGLVNELLSILAKYDDYNGVNTFAIQALKLTPENVKAYYWLIYSMYHSGAVELARNEVQRAKSVLTSEEYATLVKYLSQDESLSYSQLIVA